MVHRHLAADVLGRGAHALSVAGHARAHASSMAGHAQVHTHSNDGQAGGLPDACNRGRGADGGRAEEIRRAPSLWLQLSARRVMAGWSFPPGLMEASDAGHV